MSESAEGSEEKIEELPEGMRLVMVDPDTYVLRSQAPNAPRNEDEGKPDDIPIAVFGRALDPKEVQKEAKKIGTAIATGEVRFKPNIQKSA